jgi:hypothetical protein
LILCAGVDALQNDIYKSIYYRINNEMKIKNTTLSEQF